jgi:hypothetical protein
MLAFSSGSVRAEEFVAAQATGGVVAKFLEPAEGRGYEGGTSVEVFLRDAITGQTVHYIERAGEFLHGPHIRLELARRWP